MIFKRYRFQLILRLVVLVATALLLAYLVGWTGYFYAPIATALTIPFQIAGIVRYAEKAPRDIIHFLQSVRAADFSQGATAGNRGPLFDMLGEAFDEVMEEFRRVRSEKEEHFRYLQTVVQHIGLALIAFRDDGHVVLLNTAAKRLLEVPRLRNVQELRAVSPALTETLLRPASGRHVITRVVQDDRELLLSVYATRFRLGGEEHTIVSLQDLRSELEEKEMEAWQKLTRVLTHEIMNSAAPIASLASTAHRLLKEGNANGDDGGVIEDTREALDAIERRSEALMHFTQSYRSFTQIPTPNLAVCAAKEVCGRVHRLLRVKAEEQGIAFTVQVQPEALEMTVDDELIEQVLINLLLNAIDALEGRDDARLQLVARMDRHGHPIIQVLDNGPGIAPDLQERIFVPFFTTKADGSGIGLSLSRQIMRLHGGTLSVRSVQGVETAFTLRF